MENDRTPDITPDPTNFSLLPVAVRIGTHQPLDENGEPAGQPVVALQFSLLFDAKGAQMLASSLGGNAGMILATAADATVSKLAVVGDEG